MSIHESLVTARRSAAALIFAGAVFSFSAAGGAETRVVGVVGSEDKTVARLTLQLAAMEMRVKKLEGGLIDVQRTLRKADTPDDDGGSDKPDKKSAGGGKDASGGSGGQGAKDSGPAGGSKTGSSSSDGGISGPLKDVFPTMTLRAPFVVVDSSGKTIFRVNDPGAKGGKSGGDRGVYIYGDAGAANVALTTVYSGGKMVMQTDSGHYSVSVGAVDQGPGMKMRADNKTRAYVGLDNGGRGVVAVYSRDEQPIAGLQSTDADKGLVAVFNSGTPVAFLTQSGAHPGGGNVTTTDPGGNGVFSAGYDGEGGAACVNHKQSMHCLGTGLPLGGGQ